MPLEGPPRGRKRAPRITGTPRRVFLQLPETPDENGIAPELWEDDAPKGFTSYEDRYVLFIDILGFTELIRQSTREDAPPHGSVSAIFQALNWRFQGLEDGAIDEFLPALGLERPDEDLLKVHTFSDFVVASCPATEVGLMTILFIAFDISREWLSMKYLSRGGIARGKVLHRTGDAAAPMVFGPAFVKAYELESQVADLPRIVLEQSVRKECEQLLGRRDKLSDFVRQVTRRCDDGPRCIDVFAHLRKNGLTLARDHMNEAGQFRETIHHHLEEAADTPNWFRKSRWLAQRFNESVKNTRYAHLQVDITDV